MRYVLAGLVALLALGGCRIKKERVRGKTQVEIQGGTVRVTTDTTKLRVGSESLRVPVPRVHISTDSATHTPQ